MNEALFAKLQTVALVGGFFLGKTRVTKFRAEDIVRTHMGATEEDLLPLRDILLTMAALGLIESTEEAGVFVAMPVKMNFVWNSMQRPLIALAELAGASK